MQQIPHLNSTRMGLGWNLGGGSTALGLGIRTTSDRDLSISQTLKLEVRGYKFMKIPSLSLVQTVIYRALGTITPSQGCGPVAKHKLRTNNFILFYQMQLFVIVTVCRGEGTLLNMDTNGETTSGRNGKGTGREWDGKSDKRMRVAVREIQTTGACLSSS